MPSTIRRPGHPYFAGAPLLIAHRGGAGLAPENTLLACERAVRWWGADLLEVDVQPTRDGHAVVIHDSRLDRTTDGSGRVARHSLAEIRRVDAGARFTPDRGRSFPFRGRGLRVPTLDELLDALPGARVNVEVKDARAQDAVERAVHRAGAGRRVLIAAARRRDRKRLRLLPCPTSAAKGEIARFFALHRLGLAALHRPGTDALQIPERFRGTYLPTRRFVRDAHRLNLPVHVWTVNRGAAMERLLDAGVDGIVTDRPDRLAALLHERGVRAAAPGPPVGTVEPPYPPPLEG